LKRPCCNCRARNDVGSLTPTPWYDEQLPGLGGDFLDEAESAISSLAQNALLHSIRFHGLEIKSSFLPRPE
jgi:hypothetical protein